MIPMKKEQFVKIINAIKEYHRKIDNIQTVLEENCGIDTVFYPPSLENTLIDVLSIIFNDEGDDIEYFIYELEFGEDWEPGAITTEDGKDIKMQTAEDLYDYLIEELK